MRIGLVLRRYANLGLPQYQIFKEKHVISPKDISYYIHSKMAELNASGNFIIEATREYLPDQKKISTRLEKPL